MNTKRLLQKSTTFGLLFKKKLIMVFPPLPRGVVLLGIFGLLLGMSTNMIYSQIGMFLKHELHASELKIATIDGVVELLSYLMRVFSGAFSDWMRNRKVILVVGCVLSLVVKPLFVFAKTSIAILVAQSLDRVGNGLQAAPRDALLADITADAKRGQSYGFIRSLKTIGAFLGGVCAITILGYAVGQYRIVFLTAFIPAIIAIVILFFIKEPERGNEKKQVDNLSVVIKMRNLKLLNSDFWKIAILACIFEFGHFSEALLPIRCNDFLSPTLSTMASLFISMGQVVAAYPLGILADRFNHGIFIRVCFCIMILSNIFLWIANSAVVAFFGVFLWGCQLSATQSLFLAIISQRVSSNLRGTAIGVFYCIVGCAYMIASIVAGKLWQFGCHYSFGYSILMSLIALACFKKLYGKNSKKIA